MIMVNTDKIVGLDNLIPIIEQLRSEGKIIVFTNGCFDILHVGHVRYLEQARTKGDLLVLGLNSDSSVQGLKGSTRPFFPQEERAEMLAALSVVDYIIIFNELTPLDLIKKVNPDVLVKGGDWKKEDIVGAEEVVAAGGRMIVIPEIPGRSTSSLIAEIIRRSKS